MYYIIIRSLRMFLRMFLHRLRLRIIVSIPRRLRHLLLIIMIMLLLRRPVFLRRIRLLHYRLRVMVLLFFFVVLFFLSFVVSVVFVL